MDLEIEQKIWQQANAQIGELVRRRVCDQVWIQILCRVGYLDQIRELVCDHVANKLRVQVKVRVWYPVWDQITEDTDGSNSSG